MNKRHLAQAVAVQADVNLKTVTAVLDAFTDVVTAIVAQGEPVAITGFAKFVKVNRAARMGRNPATGEAIKIKASKKARISATKAFKDAVMNPSQAPKLKKGVWPINASAVKEAGKVAAPKAVAKKAAPAKRKTAAKKAAPKRRIAAKKAAPKRKTVKRTATRAVAKRRPATKKTATRRVVKKTVARRPAVKKAASRRPAAKKRTAARRR